MGGASGESGSMVDWRWVAVTAFGIVAALTGLFVKQSLASMEDHARAIAVIENRQAVMIEQMSTMRRGLEQMEDKVLECSPSRGRVDGAVWVAPPNIFRSLEVNRVE